MLVWLVKIYQITLSPIFGGNCRFEPSCSHYALQALQVHPPLKAVFLIVVRLSKCRPGGPCGFDPVPSTSLSIGGSVG